jgi:hypothetical protein
VTERCKNGKGMWVMENCANDGILSFRITLVDECGMGRRPTIVQLKPRVVNSGLHTRNLVLYSFAVLLCYCYVDIDSI